MAAAKAAAAAAPVRHHQLGRVSSNLRIGIVGLPNVGKSTLFNLLTKLTVPAANFPFCTIDPNEARCATHIFPLFFENEINITFQTKSCDS